MYYKAYHKKIGWYDAVKMCEAEGASLAMPRNTLEVNVLLSLISYPFLKIGFHNWFSVQKFTTIYGEDLQYYYNLWDAKQPNEGVGMCGYLSRVGKLHDKNCNSTYPFVCEKETAKRKIPFTDLNCQINDTEYRYAAEVEKCYKIHMNPEIFITAEKICRTEGGHLAIIRNLHEEIFLSSMFQEPKYTSINVKYPDRAYIGVHENFEKGYFRTVTNELFSNVNYAHWDPKKVIVAADNCVSMNKDGLLLHFPCEVPGFYICEQPSLKVPKSNIPEISNPDIQKTWSNDFKRGQETINVNIVVHMKHDIPETNIEIDNHN